MKILSTISIVCTMLTGLGCAPSIAVNHDYDTEADFAAVKRREQRINEAMTKMLAPFPPSKE